MLSNAVKSRFLIVFILLIGAAGCSSAKKHRMADEDRLQLEGRIAKLKVQNKELKSHNQLLTSILERRKKQAPTVLEAYEKGGNAPSVPAGNGFADPKSQEYFLYTECLRYFESKDEVKFDQSAQKLLATFPQGENSDAVLMMAGQMALQKKNYQMALKYFDTVSKEFPLSAKVPMSLLMKAETYRAMNLTEPARTVLARLKVKYPGTQEALQGDNLLKTMPSALRTSDSGPAKKGKIQ